MLNLLFDRLLQESKEEKYAKLNFRSKEIGGGLFLLHRWIYYVVNPALLIVRADPYCLVMLLMNFHLMLRLSNSQDCQFQVVIVEFDCCINIILEHELTNLIRRKKKIYFINSKKDEQYNLTSLIVLGRIVTLDLLRSNRSLCSSRQFWISRLISWEMKERRKKKVIRFLFKSIGIDYFVLF